MSRINCHILAAAPLLLLLSGCFGGRTTMRSETHLQADKSLSRALHAQQKGDLPAAEEFLLQSLATSTSIEDYPGMATALINLARLQRLKHEPTLAETYIDKALATAEKVSGLRSEAAYEKALIELNLGRNDSALQWAQKSLASGQLDARRGCRLNLLARIQSVRGAWAEAKELATDALKANRDANQTDEEANSLRMLGVIARHDGQYEAGMRFLEEALEIDKRIGQGGKITADLEELASTAEKAGKIKDAAEFRERARMVQSPSTATSPCSRP